VTARKLYTAHLAASGWSPAAADPGHHFNYHELGYQRNLGENVYRIRDQIRDLAHLKRIRNYRFFCPNHLIGKGERSDDPTPLDELRLIANHWGKDPVHPGPETCWVMAEKLEDELARPISSFLNSLMMNGPRRPRMDMAEHRQPPCV
jgi:hypothetical protein